jgi:hypothetical protein
MMFFRGNTAFQMDLKCCRLDAQDASLDSIFTIAYTLAAESPSAAIAKRLGDLKKVAPRIRKESHTKPHRDYIVRLRDDNYVAVFQLIYRTVYTFHTKTHVMPSRRLVAVMKIRIRWATVYTGPGQKLKNEFIVASRGEKSECKTGE